MKNTDLSDSIFAASRVQWVVGGHRNVASCVIYFGGLALHVWTSHLFFTNWGTFAGFVALTLIGFAELAAIPLVCFWWGPWFYILAVATWVTAVVSLALFVHPTLENAAYSPGTIAWTAAGIMYVCLFSLTFFAVRAASTPEVLSESERREIKEVSCVMCAVLKNCTSSDPEVLSGVVEAKDWLRARMRKYDAPRRAEVKKTVDAYLYARALFERDVRRILENGAGGIGDSSLVRKRDKRPRLCPQG